MCIRDSWYVMQHDQEHPEQARLFTEVTMRELPSTGTEAMTAQIQRLHRRIFGTQVAADGPEVAANLALWQEIYDINLDPEEAWAGLLSVLLRDPEFIFY